MHTAQDAITKYTLFSSHVLCVQQEEVQFVCKCCGFSKGRDPIG